jgi:replicative DNA helicase
MSRHGTYRPWYTVNVSGASNVGRFLDAVGGFGPREPGALALRAALASVRPNTNVDTVPREVFSLVKERMERAGNTRPGMAAMRGAPSIPNIAFSPSRTKLSRFADLLDDQMLRAHATSDLFWDRVTAIEVAEEEVVFDLTVPGAASWIADSVISHNSGAIEQDSDVVMFIHRDDSAEDLTRKGTADLIVAKHRNGPTDTIKLTFLPHLTQFRNYAPGA